MLTVVIHPFPLVSDAVVQLAERRGLATVGVRHVDDVPAGIPAGTEFVVLAEISRTTGVMSWTSLDPLRALPGWRGGVVSAALRRPQHLPPFSRVPDDLVFAPWGHVADVHEIIDGMTRYANGATLRDAWGTMRMARRRHRVHVDQATGEFIATMCTCDDAGRATGPDSSAYRRAADRIAARAREVAALHPLRDCGMQAAIDLWWEGQLEW